MSLLQRKMPLFLHGDGQHTRRYLYAGDAADALDTILHNGEIGQIYNVDSRDELSNIDVAKKLLGIFGFNDMEYWIQYTRDRQFNDRRYAVDGTKLRKLGWTQQVSLEEGLAATMNWYSKFSDWWGPIDNTLLSPFPVVRGDHVVAPEVSTHEFRFNLSRCKSQSGLCADDESFQASRKLEEQIEVGAPDDRASKELNKSVPNGIETGKKKRKAELLA